MSNLVGKFITAKRVYENFSIEVSQKITSVGLVELKMTKFGVILGLD